MPRPVGLFCGSIYVKLRENNIEIDKRKIILAILSGLLLTGSFPNINLSWLAWFALVPLLISIRNLKWNDSFRLGLITGLIHYLSLLYWLSYTMQTYGQLPWYLSVPVLFLMATYLALYIATFAALATLLHVKPAVCLFMSPALWVSLEYFRSFLFTGFPWELLGYTQYSALHIIQISDIFGVYGVSFIVLLANVTIYLGFLFFTGIHWQEIPITKRDIIAAASVSVIIIGAAWMYGAVRIKSLDDLFAGSASKKIAVVQGNIEQSLKWDPAFQIETIQKYIRLSYSAGRQKPELIVWPETATPFYFLHNARLSAMVVRGIRQIATHFLIGSPSFRKKNNRIEYFNSSYLIDPDGKAIGKYDKAHLVPFGEYVPLKKWLPFLGKMVAQVGDFVAGNMGDTLFWNDSDLGVLICYEIIFPELSRAVTQNGAKILVNITNDAWYGRTSAPYQHFSIAVLRAVENRRSLIRAANTGISGFIDPVGRVLASTQLFVDAAVTRNVPVLTKKTFYTRHGDLFAWLCLIVTLFAICRKMLKLKK
ncbi:MAG: apolipoprotein N-acyltransferase [Deltaproteobacteria bacterium]|nr:MAG: apolipoprotein N-acyltransferase [Deltaproteobacteria bacterium]